MNKVIYETKHYKIVRTDDAIGEDGDYGKPGYAVVNVSTDVTEHTTICLPGAIYQAQSFSDALENLMKAEEEPTKLSLVEMPTDDVVPN